MKNRLTPILVASSLLLGAPAVAAVSEDFPALTPKIVTEGGVSHVSGGVGEEELRVINVIAGKFNLKLLMTTKEGDYLADVDVAISDRQGNKVIETVAEGPILLASLPPGKYQVTASMNGETRQQRVDVRRSGQREVRLFW